MNFRQLLLDKGHLNRPGTLLQKVSGVIVHWTANEVKGADAEANRNYFNRKWRIIGGKPYELNNDQHGKPIPFRKASAHGNVDDKEFVSVLPWKKGEAEEGYHVGALVYKPEILKKLKTNHPNSCTIGIEICVNEDGDFQKTYANAVEVIANVLKEHNLGLESLDRHYDVTGKNCPAFFLEDYYSQKYFKMKPSDAYAKFRKDVGDKLNPPKPVSKIPEPIKERIYAVNGILKYVDLKGKAPYSFPATDVRYMMVPKGAYKMALVWAKGKTVSQLVKEYNAIYGWNGPFFNPADGNPVADVKIGSKIYANPKTGKTIAWSGVRYKNGEISIGKVAIDEDLGNDGFMFRVSPLLVENSKLVFKRSILNDHTAPDIATGYKQRTFFGVDAKGNFHLGIADGRTNSDRGLSVEEMALYLQAKGCTQAINGDGGSSTILANKNGGMNQKSNMGSNERPVHHAWLLLPN